MEYNQYAEHSQYDDDPYDDDEPGPQDGSSGLEPLSIGRIRDGERLGVSYESHCDFGPIEWVASDHQLGTTTLLKESGLTKLLASPLSKPAILVLLALWKMLALRNKGMPLTNVLPDVPLSTIASMAEMEIDAVSDALREINVNGAADIFCAIDILWDEEYLDDPTHLYRFYSPAPTSQKIAEARRTFARQVANAQRLEQRLAKRREIEARKEDADTKRRNEEIEARLITCPVCNIKVRRDRRDSSIPGLHKRSGCGWCPGSPPISSAPVAPVQ